MKTLHFDSIDSTNTYLKEHYSELENMSFVSTDEQTMGRGRNSRIWKSESGSNLLFSLLLSQKPYIERFREISILSAYTITEVLKDYDINATIKWPNDVYVNGKKICGILLEAVTKQEMECVIVGIGVNVNQKDFDSDLIHEPTSVYKELGHAIDLEKFKFKVYARLEENLHKLIKGTSFYEAIKDRDFLANKQCYAMIGNSRELVEVLGICEDFSLRIRFNNEVIKLDSDEITFHL